MSGGSGHDARAELQRREAMSASEYEECLTADTKLVAERRAARPRRSRREPTLSSDEASFAVQASTARVNAWVEAFNATLEPDEMYLNHGDHMRRLGERGVLGPPECWWTP